MKDLILRSYEAIKARGLIDENTTHYDFADKIKEEYDEYDWEYYQYDLGYGSESKMVEELTDLATVCIMQIHHLGYDFIEEFEKVCIKNENRAKSVIFDKTNKK